MSQNEEPKAELIIVGDDWERFLSSLETFMSLHQKTIQRLKELGLRNKALRQELRDAINLPRAKEEPASRVVVQEPFEPSVNRPIESTETAVPDHAETSLNRLVKSTETAVQPIKNRLKVLSNLAQVVRFPSPRASQTWNLPTPFASCEKCGRQIKRASRFCEGCGGDFGAMMCSCGRELNPGDKFCDHCGRTV
ncbi:MAG TPA: zinc ribbon domain-containing protein [Candidatus Bathyarchaeia archaeon]|nr:zinc ribbon domain-containing protein [Candidatus Bathyarchaeia archaeon]